MHAIKVKGEETFQINLLNDHHSCLQIFEVKNVKTNWIKDKYLQKFKSDPKRNVKGFRVDIINELRVNVSRHQAYRAKNAALKQLEDGEERFSRFLCMLWALKAGFKAGCRPIIGVDGCHLKGPNGGILLTAIGVDPNNNLFPIAYAVVNKECRETWEWFLIVLKHDLNIIREHEYTFMSDKQKGLMQAFEEVFPGCDHRFCVRHLHNNFKQAGFRGLAFKNALWNAAKSCTVGEWKMRMQEMKNLSQQAYDWFNDKPAVQWSRSHFSEASSCDMLLNNVFNIVWILGQRVAVVGSGNCQAYHGGLQRQEERESDEPTLKNKKKSKREQVQKIKRHQTTVHCRTCGEPGHNTAKCPERVPLATQEMTEATINMEGTSVRAGKRKAPTNAVNRIERDRDTSTGTQGANILPPLQPVEDPILEPCITQVESQAAEVPVYKPGPSMYQQLQQSNQHLTLQPRVQIRAPPPMTSIHGLPVFSTTSRAQAGNHNPIITEGGQKFLDLSQLSSSDV
ncbi:hypothetical protein Sango_2825000 [Sesamum angolense]|uniref:CCHC-type domain-containing protein n=1 Tax=Sesamum angolense TaxID=2727404 RepID=A0AAE1VWJ2_9LAMI|nr:hypothetical protein Sango_2825000 [Sesamum angolense]